MRFIVACLFTATLLAQTSQLESLEKQIQSAPNRPGLRMRILQAVTGPDPGVPIEKIIETRRRQILWLIEFQGDNRDNYFLMGTQLIPPSGPFADLEGYVESVRLWNQRTSAPGASTQTIANAADYLKATDRPAARALLASALRDHPDDAALGRALGHVDAAAILGISGIGDRGQFVTSAELRAAPEAEAALQEIESSANPSLMGAAGELIFRNGVAEIPFDALLGGEDRLTLAEKWLRRAIQLAPPGDPWKGPLSQVLRNEASLTQDSKQKLRLLSEAMDLATGPNKASFVPDIAAAEYELGDDAAAGRDARRMLDGAPALAKPNPSLAAILTNRGNVILGRVALAHGDKAEARERLLASLRVPESTNLPFNGPDLTLAQDLVDSGEKDAVLQFLEQSRSVWKFDRGQIDHLIKVVGKSPSPDLLTRNFRQPSPAAAFDLRDLDGKEWTLKSLAGKSAALEFFRPECRRCSTETFPELERAAVDFAARGGVVLAIGVGPEDAVRRFAESNRLTMPVLVDPDGAAARRYQIEASPSLVWIGPQGIASNTFAGFAPTGSISGYLKQGPSILEAPVPLAPADGAVFAAPARIELAWQPVANAESYVAEWDNGESDAAFHVIPTRETSVSFECPSAARIRWRVYAVPRFGIHGKPSEWREIRARE